MIATFRLESLTILFYSKYKSFFQRIITITLSGHFYIAIDVLSFAKQKKYTDIAREKNLHVVEFKPETQYTPTVLASPTEEGRQKVIEETADGKPKNAKQQHDTDLNLYLFNNRDRLEKKFKKPFYSDYPSYKQYLVRKKKVWPSFQI